MMVLARFSYSLAFLALFSCSKPAGATKRDLAPDYPYDPGVGELVVRTDAASKRAPTQKEKWLALAAATMGVTKSQVESAKAKARERLADLADDVGDKVGAAEDLRKLVELTDEQFVDLGRRCARKLDSINRVIPLPDPRAARLSALVSPHAGEDGVNLSVKLYDSPIVNAFALPDGSIRVFSGLLDLATDDELRAILGHEIGHVVQKHAKASAQIAMLASAGAKAALKAASADAAKPGLLEDLASHIAQALVNARYSRAKERQADDYAFAFVMTNRYEPEGLVSFFEKLGNERQVSPFASHPPSALRAERMRELIAKASRE